MPGARRRLDHGVRLRDARVANDDVAGRRASQEEEAVVRVPRRLLERDRLCRGSTVTLASGGMLADAVCVDVRNSRAGPAPFRNSTKRTARGSRPHARRGELAKFAEGSHRGIVTHVARWPPPPIGGRHHVRQDAPCHEATRWRQRRERVFLLGWQVYTHNAAPGSPPLTVRHAGCSAFSHGRPEVPPREQARAPTPLQTPPRRSSDATRRR